MSSVQKKAKITIKTKKRPEIKQADKGDDEYVPLIENEAELDYDVDEEGNVKEVVQKNTNSAEDEARKRYKKLKLKKQKMQPKGFEVVESVDIVQKRDSLDIRRHINLRGNEDEDLDGVSGDPYKAMLEQKRKQQAKDADRKRKRDEKNDQKKNDHKKKEQKGNKANAPVEEQNKNTEKGKNKKQKSADYLSSEKNVALSLIQQLASEQEEWAETQVKRVQEKHDKIQEKLRLKEEQKARAKELKEKAMAEALQLAKEKKKFKKEVNKE